MSVKMLLPLQTLTVRLLLCIVVFLLTTHVFFCMFETIATAAV
jgi:hypothetical protein